MKKLLSFKDVGIQPQYSEIEHRNTVNLTSTLKNRYNKNIILYLPIISANMPNITGPKMAIAIFNNGGISILPRTRNIVKDVEDFKSVIIEPGIEVGVSIGVQDVDRKRFTEFTQNGARIFCIDVAHGHHSLTRNMLNWIFNTTGKNRHEYIIIAGNIATSNAAYDLSDWGADIVKVGIAGGSVCRTRYNTGVYVPQLQAIKDVHEAIQTYHLPIQTISDGGISNVEDIAKALRYTDFVMVGGVLAGTAETPGKVYPVPGTDLINRQYYKLYGGNASGENKIANGQRQQFVEGEMKTVPFKGHVEYILKEIKEGLQSAFSYTNALNIEQYKQRVMFTTDDCIN